MDSAGFDHLARLLVMSTPRRGLLRLGLGSGLATLLFGQVAEEALACRAPGKPCQRRRQCCSKRCSRRGRCLCAKAAQCPRPANPCKEAACTGKGRCTRRNASSQTVCAPAQCTSENTLQQRRFCDGTGTCADPITVSCGLYRCSASAGGCFTSCGGPVECVSDAHCVSGTCRPTPPDLISVSVPDPVRIADGPVEGTVTLDRPADGDTTITVESDDPSKATVSDATVLDGQTTGAFPVTGIAPGEVTVTARLGATTVQDTFQVVA